MRDWEALVGEQLAGLSLEPKEAAEVIAELAAHLEETFEELRQQGLSEEGQRGAHSSQVGNWPSLRRKIQKARRRRTL